MKKSSRYILLSSLVLLVLLIVLFPTLKKNSSAKVEELLPGNKERVTKVAMMEVNSRSLEEMIKITGVLESNEEVALKPEGSGNISQLFFEEGDYVKKGALLATLNTNLHQADLQKAMSQLKLRKDTEKRQAILLKRKAISQEEYDIAHAELLYIQAEIQQIKAQLEQKKIYAPFAGYVGLRNYSVGDYISATSNIPLATLYDNSPIKLEFGVASKHLSLFGKGTKVYFTVDAYEDVFEAEIYAVNPKIDEETRTVTARALCANSDNRLLSGLFASINMVVATYPNAILIPSDALIAELNNHKLFVYKDGKAEERNVSLGKRTSDEVQITEGLYPGEMLIINGIQTLKDGSKVDATVVNKDSIENVISGGQL